MVHHIHFGLGKFVHIKHKHVLHATHDPMHQIHHHHHHAIQHGSGYKKQGLGMITHAMSHLSHHTHKIKPLSFRR